MKIIKSIVLFALAIFLFTTCKKEGPAGPAGPQGDVGQNGSGIPNPGLYTKWQVVSGQAGTKYVIFKSNNSYYELDSTALGFKSLISGLALITGTQISCWGVYDYTISNDTLRLTNLSGTIVLKKNTNAPAETQWITYVTVTDSIVNPAADDGREDIGFDGTNILWIGASSSNNLNEINPSTHAVTAFSLSASYYYGAVEFASSFMWISNDETIDKVNPTTGAIVSTSPTLASNQIRSLALVGSDMWFADWNGNIFTWNIISNTITPQFQQYITGMENVGGYLYMYRGPYLYKCQVSPFKVLTTYYINSPDANNNGGGITNDGTRFWVVGYNYNASAYKLLKLSI